MPEQEQNGERRGKVDVTIERIKALTIAQHAEFAKELMATAEGKYLYDAMTRAKAE